MNQKKRKENRIKYINKYWRVEVKVTKINVEQNMLTNYLLKSMNL